MVTKREAEGAAFRELVQALQGEKPGIEKTTLRLALSDLEHVSGGHATFEGILALFETMRQQIFWSRYAILQFYLKERYPIGSSFRIDVSEAIELVGLIDPQGSVKIEPGIYTINVVETPARIEVPHHVAWGVPKGMTQGTSLERWYELLGLTNLKSEKKADLLES